MQVDGVPSLHLALFFLLKVVAGITLTLIYTYYYTDTAKNDIYKYYNDSVVVSKILFESPYHWAKVMLGIDMYSKETFAHILPTLYFDHPSGDIATSNKLLIRITSLFNYLSYYSIYINTLFFNFACFIGLVALLKALRRFVTGDVRWLYLALFLLPSMVFWSSGLLKDQLLFTFIGLYLYVLLLKEKTWQHWFFAVLLLYAVFAVKSSVAAPLLIASVFLPIFNVSLLKRTITVGVVKVTAVVLAFTTGFADKACAMLLEKRNEFVFLSLSENAGSNIDSTIYALNCGNLFSILPAALVNTILRPFVWQQGSHFQLIFAAENAIFLSLLLAVVYFIFKNKGPRTEANLSLALFCIIFSLFNYLIIGLTVPIMGAIVHYRVIAAPFLLLGLVMLLKPKQA